MIRRFLLLVAVLAIGGFVAAPVQAGAPRQTKVPIRFKNIGTQPVIVNAQYPNTGGGVALSQNGVYRGDVNAGAFAAYATGVTNKITKSLQGNSRSPIYLFVQADNTATTITVAPPY